MMSTGNTHPSASNSRSRQQRHPENESVNGFLPASSSGSFLLPADGQGAFTFSTEPAMIDYSSMAGLTPSTAQDSVFTPNTAGDSSFDSSLHPDYLNQSYPPPNYMQTQRNYILSPGLHSRTGHSISPSHSIDHLSPEAAYLSDTSHQDPSNYTSPSYTGQYLEEPFSNLNFADGNTTTVHPNAFEPFTQMPMLTPDNLATYNAQAQLLPSQLRPEQTQLLSPSPTNNSSPALAQDAPMDVSLSDIQQPRQDGQTSTSPPAPMSGATHTTPKKQQADVAVSISSGGLLASPEPLAAHLTSPIVRVEHYSRDDSPSHSDGSRAISKRSRGSRRSSHHLSPFPVDDSSEDEHTQTPQVRLQTVARSAERADDGSWIPSTGSGQAGLSPDDRHAMGDVLVPTIEEMERLRLNEDKKIEVHEWLSKSEVGSEAGDPEPPSTHLKPFTTRRRAKSTNDAPCQYLGEALNLVVRTDLDQLDDSGIPGPGLYINERSEYEESEDDDDDVVEEDTPESPVAEIDVHASHHDDSYFPIVAEEQPGAVVRPWMDTPSHPLPSSSTTAFQPPTANAAIMRFKIRARDVETASLAATLGSRRSRRLSESDLGSIRHAPGVSKAIAPDLKKQKERERRPSFLNTLLPKRTPSNLLKRKSSIPVQPPEPGSDKSKDGPIMEKPKRIGSWGRPKSPRLDTSFTNSSGTSVGPPSATNLSATNGPWYQGAKNAIRRSRSRSDLGKSFGLAELMTQHGGPPMPMLASPLAETEATKASPMPSPVLDDDDDEGNDAVVMDLKVRSDPIIPTYEGFQTHARQLNPRLVDYMVERITQEQMRRYKRLCEFRVKHLNAVKNRNCASAKFCTALGGSSKSLPPRAGNKDSDAPFIGFQITRPGTSDDDGEPPSEGTVVSAQFPSGVPLPPVKRLPAEFECPLCFKVKKFYKPSDWTKHVHEDVQPFTCTFPSCGEPKSFKRKADWVRHENERHRQLENWTCQIADCNHTCYRKDNFVQHLVREHKIAEPKGRTGRAGREGLSGSDTEDIWSLVERCRRDTFKQPRDEPCRFCGNICNSWKKLTVHLAKHMEQISMPILPLIEQKHLDADTVISPLVELPEHKLSRTPSKSPIDNPSRYKPSATSITLAPGIDPNFHFPQTAASSAVASATMQTYPPPQFAYKGQQQMHSRGNSQFAIDNVQNTMGQTYPYPSSRSQSPYPIGQQQIALQAQPYPANNLQNGATQYAMAAPISTVGQQPQVVLTSSPVEVSMYPTGNLGTTTYFTQEPQDMTDVNGGAGVADMGFDGNGMQYAHSTYPGMAYMGQQQQQQHFQYHG